MMNGMRAEFKDEINNMKLNLDYFVSLVDPATLQAALSSVPSLGGQVANLPNVTREQPKSASKVTPPNFQQHNPTPNFLTSHERAANGNKRHKHTFDCNPCEVGSNVLLFCSEVPKESVAEGVVLSMDPKEEIDDVVLGPGFIKVVIKRAIEPNYYLLRPRKGVNTVGQAVGKIVAWQIANVRKFVILKIFFTKFSSSFSLL
ncbi:hypothetical protein ACJIZ3_003743 [Penstemon smallii]|uniref:Transposase Tnp1/En/Spm-like domain-containing protein n=1 Tax=Penstemon smallii TaxID=265156 RepID=A0ABD3UD72_9LAMI